MGILWLALSVTWLGIVFIIWVQFQMMRQSGAILTRPRGGPRGRGRGARWVAEIGG